MIYKDYDVGFDEKYCSCRVCEKCEDYTGYYNDWSDCRIILDLKRRGL